MPPSPSPRSLKVAILCPAPVSCCTYPLRTKYRNLKVIPPPPDGNIPLQRLCFVLVDIQYFISLREETTVKHPVLTVYEKWVPKCATLTQSGTNATLPPPPPLPGNEKLADLELSSQVGLQISRCHSPPPLQKWKVGRFGTFKLSWT